MEVSLSATSREIGSMPERGGGVFSGCIVRSVSDSRGSDCSFLGSLVGAACWCCMISELEGMSSRLGDLPKVNYPRLHLGSLS